MHTRLQATIANRSDQPLQDALGHFGRQASSFYQTGVQIYCAIDFFATTDVNLPRRTSASLFRLACPFGWP